MAEKILNTRIQLKYDTLANWNASTFNLKAGELAIVTLGEVKDGSAPKADQHPVLFKVGTGSHKFSELPFASALAADVYAWAKASDVVLSGKTIQFKNGENVVKSVVLNYLDKSEVDALILVETNRAKGEEARIEGLVTAEATAARAAEKALGERIDAFNLPEGGFASKSEFDLLKGKVEDEDGALARANAAYTLAEGKVATSDFEIFKTNNTKAISDAQAAAEGKVTTLANGAVKDNADAIAAIKDHATVDSFADVMTEMAKYQLSGDYATKAEAQGYADAKDAAIKAAKDAADAAQSDVDTLSGTHATDKAALEGAIALKADKSTFESEISRVEGLVSAEATKAREEEGKLNTRLVEVESFFKLAEGESLDTALDTLVEIQKYLDGEGEVADKMLLDIAANKKAIEDEAKRADTEEKRLAGLIEDNAEAIEALGIVDGKVESAAMADKANSLTDNAKEEVKAVKVNNATNADKAADADKLGGVVASNYALKTDAQGYADQALIDAKAYADQAELDAVSTSKSYTDGRETAIKAAYEAYADQAELDAIDNAKDYTDEREVEIKKYADQAEADAIASAKSYTDGREVEIKKYADQAEADAKAYADGLAKNYATAAQGAKADSALQSIEAGTGLKVSAKADNKQTIDIDESVVFVFDCGSATKLID